MFTLLRVLPAQSFVIEQLPAMVIAWLVTEVFFKFHSFTLELLAFLAVWGVVDGAIQFVSGLTRKSRRNSDESVSR